MNYDGEYYVLILPKIGIEILFSTIYSKNLDMSLKLGFNHFLKYFEGLSG